MNDINTVEVARAVSSTGGSVQDDQSTETAKQGSQPGKSVPVLEQKSRPAADRASVAVAEQRSQDVSKAIEQLNDYVQSLQRDLRFSLDDDLGRAVVRVIDSSTQEVIRQIPNETALQLARNLKDAQEQQLQDRQYRAVDSSTAGTSQLGLVNTKI